MKTIGSTRTMFKAPKSKRKLNLYEVSSLKIVQTPTLVEGYLNSSSTNWIYVNIPGQA